MKRTIVTGALGFIGSELVTRLLSEGTEVYAVVRPSAQLTRTLPVSDSLHIIPCDMSRYSALPEMIPTRDIDVFYHFAWEGSAGPLRSDEHVQLLNIQYTVDAVRAASQLRCRRFCGAGSIMEHEANLYLPLPTSVPSGAYKYSVAKLTAHYMAKITAAETGIDFIWGEISNAFGVGEISQRFVLSTIRNMLTKKAGDFTEGRQLYDFLYVSDMAKAFLQIGERGQSGWSYFLGSGQPLPLREYITRMRDTLAPDFVLRFGAIPYAGAELPAAVFDTSPLVRDTGFVPEVSFEEGIRRTAAWIKMNSL